MPVCARRKCGPSIATTGATPHTNTVPSDSTDAIAGNRHYSTDVIEGPMLRYYNSLVSIFRGGTFSKIFDCYDFTGDALRILHYWCSWLAHLLSAGAAIKLRAALMNTTPPLPALLSLQPLNERASRATWSVREAATARHAVEERRNVRLMP